MKNVKTLPDASKIIDKDTVNAKALIISLRALPSGAKVEPHSHGDEEQAYFVIAGRGRVRVGDEEREVGPFDMVYIPPGEVHGVEALRDEEFRYLYAVALLKQ